MLNITKEQNGGVEFIILEGRLDTNTAPTLEDEIKDSLEGISELVFDLSRLEYISSAGLRVLLTTQKAMNKQGNMVVKNVSPAIMEIFEVTGFSDILTID
ncbi:anti-sigma B factor antagonist [Pseudobutyrivibrio sp. YE44]|uniref:STAS domain-containing protein n=1 Tax=Pseudobutyrivibrio sp. YE44 TaxID=1520802 RepID=UPI00088D2B84|nr:STAS domain-containing protein [Pseudobutyrivibrio sp. YE44]SDB25001.1 anti-sigma B factor antagonist [Pseudobutyrivibrio sp. YE44]